jgi:outer membrane receptor for ferrienterochelin and colicin
MRSAIARSGMWNSPLMDLLNVKAVSAVPHEQKQLDSPRSMPVITGEEICRRNHRTVPEALWEMVGVMVQETKYAFRLRGRFRCVPTRG